MSATIYGTITLGLTLTNTPETIARTGIVLTQYSNSVESGGDNICTLANLGTIVASGLYTGVFLGYGGEVYNAIDGTILGDIGIQIAADGTLFNGGTILSTDQIYAGGGYGAIIQNALIRNYYTGLIGGYRYGVVLGSNSSLLYNYGTIFSYATAFSGSSGIVGLYGGTVVNELGGEIDGYTGIKGITSIQNAGTIIGSSNYGVLLNKLGDILINGSTGIIETGTYNFECNAVDIYDYGVLTNFGSIVNFSNSGSSSSIYINAGGYVSNAPTGLIMSNAGPGLVLSAGISTVINAGRIVATQAIAIDLLANGQGSITNFQNAVIEGLLGGIVSNSPATITNSGLIASEKGIALDLGSGGTLIDAGYLNANTGTAAYLGGTSNNRVELFPGASWSGLLVGGTTAASNALELSSGDGVLSSNFANFGTIAFDEGAAWRLVGNIKEFQAYITGFTNSDTIVIEDLAANRAAFADGLLTITDNALPVGTLRLVGSLAPDAYSVSFTGNEVVVNVACFCRGTQIATSTGQRAVEELGIGDRVLTVSGSLHAIKWIGRRKYEVDSFLHTRDILPVLIRKGAILDGVPQRDVRVSRKHALFLDGILIPAELLVNGASIREVEHIGELTYFHIELEAHDILLAEGMAAESFIDCKSRIMFDNHREFKSLYPDDVSEQRSFYAPRVEDGQLLEIVRRRIARRAGLVTNHIEDKPDEGCLHGRIDRLDHFGICGWAWDVGRLHTPVQLEFLIDGAVVGSTVANIFRQDLLVAGVGSGRSSFDHRFEGPLSVTSSHVIEVRRRADRMPLPGTPVNMAPDGTLSGALDGRIDVCNRTMVAGWAIDMLRPAIPVRLVIEIDGIAKWEVVADEYRNDLEKAGKREGRCSFSIMFGQIPLASVGSNIVIRRTSDGAVLASLQFSDLDL